MYFVTTDNNRYKCFYPYARNQPFVMHLLLSFIALQCKILRVPVMLANVKKICRLSSVHPDEISSFRVDKRMSTMRVNLFNGFCESTAQLELKVWGFTSVARSSTVRHLQKNESSGQQAATRELSSYSIMLITMSITLEHNRTNIHYHNAYNWMT